MTDIPEEPANMDVQELFRQLRKLQTVMPATPASGNTREVTPQQRGTLWFADQIKGFLLQQIQPHPQLAGTLQSLLLTWNSQWLTRPDVCLLPGHPLTRMVSDLLDHACIWEPSVGKLGNRFPRLMEECTREIARADQSDRKLIGRLQSELNDYRQQRLMRVRRVADRIAQSEHNEATIAKARSTVLDFIDQRLFGKRLPDEVDRFVRNILISDLQHLVLREGVEGSRWKLWKRLLQVLSWCYSGVDESTPMSPDKRHSWRQKRDTLLPPILEGLNDSYFLGFPTEEAYPQFFHYLMGSFMQLMQDKPVACVTFGSPAADRVSPALILDQSMLEDSKEFETGSWFRFSDHEGVERRAQLILQQPRRNLLLFCSYQQNILRYSFDEFRRTLAIKVATPVAANNLYPRGIQFALTQLQRMITSTEQKQQQDVEAKVRQRAAEKAEQEARLLEQQSALHEPASISADQRNRFQRELDGLICGSWVLLQKTAEEAIRIRLSVKLATRDKFIFTDRFGVRTAEYTQEDLVQLLASNKLQVLSGHANFDNSLEQIVRGLRKNK